MNKQLRKYTVAPLAVLFLLVLGIGFASIDAVVGGGGDALPQESVEVGFTAQAPTSASGEVVPASCPSYTHYPGNCQPPDFNSSTDDTNGNLNEGDNATLEWSGVYSSSCDGVNFSTGGAVSGSAAVSPTDTTTYEVVCDNGGRASKTITVIKPNLSIQAADDRIQRDTTTTITWSATQDVVESCQVTEDNPDITDSWSGASGSEETSNLEFETTYTLTCTTEAGDTSESVTVEIIPFFEEF